MKITNFIFLISGILLFGFFQYCKKPTEDWVFCDGCGIDSWVGNYTGVGSYYKDEGNEITDGVDVQLEIENPMGSQFLIKVLSPGYYSQSFFSSKTDSLYYFNIANQTSSINMNLYKKTGEFKINGVAKKGHWEWSDTVQVFVPDHSLSFEVFKNP